MKRLLLLTIFFLSDSALAADPDFYEKKAEGWFWYAEPEPVVVPEEPEVKEPEPIPVTPPQTVDVPEEEGPTPLSVVWFQENLTKTLHRAIDYPTEENIKAYYVLHKIMTEKSHHFADQSRLVALKNPSIGNFGGRTGTNAQVSRVQKFQKDLLKDIGARLRDIGGGIIFFHDNSVLSEQLALSMEKLQRFDGIDVRGVRVTAANLGGKASHLFQDSIVAPQLHEAIGLRQVPSLALAIPPADPIVLVDGMASRTEIQRRIATFSKEYDVVSDDEYERFVGRNPGFAPKQISNAEIMNIDVDDPQSIIALEALLENP